MEATRVSQPVASPLEGRVARCPKCASFTYDVTGLSDEEVRRLVLETEGRVLNRLVSRTDGRSMSVDCGHGTVRPPSPRRRRAVGMLVAVALVAAGVSGIGAGTGLEHPPLGPAYDAAFFAEQDVREAEQRAADLAAPSAPGLAPPVVADGTSLTEDQFVLHSTSELVPQPVLDEHGQPITWTVEPGDAAWGPIHGDVHLADVTASWSKQDVSTAQLVETVETQLEPVRKCYGDLLKVDQEYRGTLTTHLNVERSGTVSRVSLPDRSNKQANVRLRQCVEGALQGLRFGRHSSAVVSFRLIFAGAR